MTVGPSSTPEVFQLIKCWHCWWGTVFLTNLVSLCPNHCLISLNSPHCAIPCAWPVQFLKQCLKKIPTQKQKKSKTDAAATANGNLTPKITAKTNGHSTSSTPAQSSEDSSSDSEKEMVCSPVLLSSFECYMWHFKSSELCDHKYLLYKLWSGDLFFVWCTGFFLVKVRDLVQKY